MLAHPLRVLFETSRVAMLSAILAIVFPIGAQELEVATTVALTEGPTVDREGNVYFTEMMSDRILKLSVDGVLSTYREHSNGALGMLIDPENRLVVCERGAHARITRTDLRSGKMEILADNYQGSAFQKNGPNDVSIDNRGRLYFTDTKGVAVYRIDTDGKLARILAAPDIQRPNGIQISPDDKTLYLVESKGTTGGARMIRSYDLLPDGTVRNMKVFYNFYPGRSADGLSVDVRGNVYASAGRSRTQKADSDGNPSAETLDTKTGLYIISPRGELLKFIPIPEDLATNNAFGGPDMKTLYITAGATLYKVHTDVPGLPR